MRLVPDYLIGIATVFQEAEGEPYDGKVAVAEVILRRTKRKFMSDGTVVGTCLRRLQFSGWNNDSPNRIRSLQVDTSTPVVNDCVRAWMEAERGSDKSCGATHYANLSICNPSWAADMEVSAVIGHHTFFKEGK